MDQAARLRAMMTDGSACGTLERLAPNPLNAGSVSARVIAVTSGKGGVGKTTMAVNLALLLAEEAQSVLIVDADLGLANVDVMLGLEPARHIGHLLTSDTSPEDVAAVGPAGVRVISGGSGLKELAEAAGSERRLLLNKLRGYYDSFDYVLVDTSPGIGDDVADFLTDAREVLLITTTEPTSLRDTYAAAKTIYRRAPHLVVSPVVNMAATDSQAAEAVSVLNEVAAKFLGLRYERWHRIEPDALVGRAIRARCPFVTLYPRSPAAISLRRLARSLIH